MTSAPSPSYEAATIVRRLAYKLGCGRVVLVGTVRPGVLTGLGPLRVAGFDALEHVGYAAALLQTGTFAPLEQAGEALREASDAIVVLSPAALDGLGTDVAQLLASAPAVLVVDLDEADTPDPDALLVLLDRLRSAGLTVVHGELIAVDGGTTHRRNRPAAVVTAGDPTGLHALLATGLHNLRLDRTVDTLAALQDSPPARVCIVSYEVVGPVNNGGIGTANTSLAQRLAAGGHDVTLLFTGTPRDEGERARWRAHFAERGVTYDQLDPERVARVRSPHINVRRSWEVYRWVLERHRQQPFDVIHAPECQGHAAFIAAARRQGLAFTDAQIVLGVHSTTRWCAEANRRPLTSFSALVDEHLERESVENADVVISPSGYLLGYLRSRGWRLPDRSFVQQYTRSEAVLASDGSSAEAGQQVRELVFFGRLETRKGLVAFCDALDLLAARSVDDGLLVTFLGSPVQHDGVSSAAYVEQRAAAWPWEVAIETDRSQPEAVAHLRRGGCLAVMPSLVDNSPNTVYEALALGIPFVVSRSGGTAELIAPHELARCSFAGWPQSARLEPIPAELAPPSFDAGPLADVLERALVQPAASVEAAIDPVDNEAVHIAWHGAVARAAASAEPNARPTRVSLVEEPSNAAAHAAESDLLVFVTSGVELASNLEQKLETAAARSTADVLLLVTRDGADAEAPPLVPVSGPALLALAHPFTGDFAIRADALRALGGFDECLPRDESAAELLARASIAGLRIEVLADVVGRRRESVPDPWPDGQEQWLEALPWSVSGEQQLARLRPFVAAANGSLSDVPGVMRGLQELLAQVREAHLSAIGDWRRISEETADWANRTKQAYDDLEAHTRELQAHADRLQVAHDELLAHSQRVQDAHDRQYTHSEALQRRLDIVYGSKSWRLLEPARRLAHERRRRLGRETR